MLDVSFLSDAILINLLVGVLAGATVQTVLNNKKIYQEVIWYVDKDHRREGVTLLKKVMKILKEDGYQTMVMMTMGNSRVEKIHQLYNILGFKLFETQFIREL